MNNDESLRLNEVAKYNLSFDTPESSFTELAEIAKLSLDVPFSGISIVDEHHVWLKARVGVDVSSLTREGAFCSYAVTNNKENYIVEDTLKNELFTSNPLVVEMKVRFYAAATLRNEKGFCIGTLWIMDLMPRKLDMHQITLLNSLASQAIKLLDYKYTNLITHLPNKSTFTNRLQSLINNSLSTDDEKDIIAMVGVIYIRNMEAIENITSAKLASKLQNLIAEKIAESFSLKYTLAHFENDLFAFVIEADDLNHYENDISILSKALAEPIHLDNYPALLCVSIGLAECPFHGVNASSLLVQVITVAKCHREQKQGVTIKKCSRISPREYIQELHADIKSDDKSSIIPFYQPQVNVSANKVIGLEALARWSNNKLGYISPENFIPIAEDSGLITALDLLILKNVCDDLSTWHSEKIALVPVSVNFSRTTLLSKDLIARVKKIIFDHKKVSHFIKLEITESTMLYEGDPAGQRIKELQALGLMISIDDFGTGFSNLSTLRLLSFDQLKVDRQFIHNISVSLQLSDLFSFIQNIASLFSVSLMCEGMENESDIDVLIAKKCSYMQGWYFSKAIPAYQVANLLKYINLDSDDSHINDYKALALMMNKLCQEATQNQKEQSG